MLKSEVVTEVLHKGREANHIDHSNYRSGKNHTKEVNGVILYEVELGVNQDNHEEGEKTLEGVDD